MVISDKFQVITRLERPAFNTQEMNAKSRTGILQCLLVNANS